MSSSRPGHVALRVLLTMAAAAALGSCAGGGSGSSSTSTERATGDVATRTTDELESDDGAILSLRVVDAVMPPPCDVTTSGAEPVRSDDEMCYLLDSAPVVTEHDIAEAQVLEEPGVAWVVSASLGRAGAERFREAVDLNSGRQLAIVIDGVVVSAPRLQPGITSEAFQINGDFERGEAIAVAARISGVPADEVEVVPAGL